MGHLITPAELPAWVPGETVRSSEGLGWKGVGLRSYRYEALDVAVPGLADFMIVSYKRGSTRMERRFEGRWTRTECHPGDLSLLTRSQDSHWHWTEGIEVAHAYLSESLVSSIAADVLDRSIADVRLHDLLRTQDPVITSIVDAIAEEASVDAMGGAIYVEALGMQLAVRLLRNYASVSYREPAAAGRLSPSQRRSVIDYIETHLQDSPSVEDLSVLAGMGAWTFCKRFRQTFGKAPHAYIIDQRIARAQQLLAHGAMPVKAIASACGFADQSHMTRLIRTRTGSTPAALRRNAGT